MNWTQHTSGSAAWHFFIIPALYSALHFVQHARDCSTCVGAGAAYYSASGLASIPVRDNINKDIQHLFQLKIIKVLGIYILQFLN